MKNRQQSYCYPQGQTCPQISDIHFNRIHIKVDNTCTLQSTRNTTSVLTSMHLITLFRVMNPHLYIYTCIQVEIFFHVNVFLLCGNTWWYNKQCVFLITNTRHFFISSHYLASMSCNWTDYYSMTNTLIVPQDDTFEGGNAQIKNDCPVHELNATNQR